MMSVIDETHDPRRGSWVASASGHAEFPVQNLPFGIFSPAGGAPRGGVAIGDMIFDLPAGLEAGLFSDEAARAAEAAAGAALNPLMALGSGSRIALRKHLSALLSADNPERAKSEGLAPQLLHNAGQHGIGAMRGKLGLEGIEGRGRHRLWGKKRAGSIKRPGRRSPS